MYGELGKPMVGVKPPVTPGMLITGGTTAPGTVISSGPVASFWEMSGRSPSPWRASGGRGWVYSGTGVGILIRRVTVRSSGV